MGVRPAAHAGRLARVARWARVATAALIVTACGVLSPEEQLLTDFFEASRLYDTTTVARMSSVVFNPRTDGVVQDFEVQETADQGTSRRVRVRAAVRQSDGAAVERILVFTLERRADRWFIEAIDGQGSDGP